MRKTATATIATVWDLPTRLFHWGLVLLVAGLWVSGKTGALNLHMTLGKAALALLLFRLAWGIAGSDTARFSQFVKGPRAVADYLRATRIGRPWPTPGHNPLGAFSVLALMALALVQAVSGLFTTDDILVEGPLTHLVSGHTASLLSSVHRIGFWLLLALVALHVAAIIFYRVAKREDLLRPMVTGRKRLAAGIRPPRMADGRRALVLAAAAAALVWGGLALAA